MLVVDQTTQSLIGGFFFILGARKALAWSSVGKEFEVYVAVEKVKKLKPEYI